MNNTARVTMYACLIGLVCVAMGASGCRTRQQPIQPDLGARPSPETQAPATGGGEGLPDIDPSTIRWGRGGDFDTVYFDYDSHALRPDARAALQKNADFIRRLPANVHIMLEGHCDERGTQEYNLALGERRAQSVRRYLMDLGISGDRLLTTSWGKERPAVPGSNEAAWAQNRRVEFQRAM